LESNWRFGVWEFGLPTGDLLGGRWLGGGNLGMFIRRSDLRYIYFYMVNTVGTPTYSYTVAGPYATKAALYATLTSYVGPDHT